MTHTIYTIKLKNSDSLLAEAMPSDFYDSAMLFRNILQVEPTPEGLTVKNYFPFSTHDKEHKISTSDILLIDKVDEDVSLLYYNSVLQMKIDLIKLRTERRLSGNAREDYFIIFESVQKIKEVSSEYHEKYGISLPDLSEMEKQLEEKRPLTH